MGCTSAPIEENAIRVIPLDYGQVNSYLDKLPLFIIQKLKEKFDMHCDDQGSLDQHQFRLLYSSIIKHSQSPENVDPFIQRLYLYYNDLEHSNLKFRKFISKYATLNHCEERIFSNIIYFLFCHGPLPESEMRAEQYNFFIQSEQKFFKSPPLPYTELTISKEMFSMQMIETGFLWKDYQKMFALINRDDMPFEAIGRGLIEMDLNDFEIGAEYYLISAAWFERWSFYYLGSEEGDSNHHLKSTKMLKKKDPLSLRRRRNGGSTISKKPSMREMSIDDATWIIERPTQITFEEIEGEFYGQLKENLRSHYECKIISKDIWQMMKKTIPAEFQLMRLASSPTSLDLYPKMIYYLQTDSAGNILNSTLRIQQMHLKARLSEIETEKDEKTKVYFFIKNLGESIWSEEPPDSMLARCSTEPRFFVVKTISKIGFVEKYLKRKKTIEDITYGDQVFSYFSLKKKIIPAYVIGLPSPEKVKIHYQGFSFRYEIDVPLQSISNEEISLQQSIKNPLNAARTATEVFSFKGIKNIGNTCFINSVIQSLIATPIIGNYISQSKFDQNKQPLLFQISKIGVQLLSNRNVSPVNLKKAIDVHLDVFSGHDQHDAQEFLSLLLDKFSEEIKSSKKQLQKAEGQTIVDEMFGGIVESTIICQKCSEERKIKERVSIVSLPIPQPEYNTFTIFVFPIYDQKIRKVILRLHRSATVKDYLREFEDRIGANAEDYFFIQIQFGNTKRIRSDLFEQKNQRGVLLQSGLTPNIEIQCFEKLREKDLMMIVDENQRSFRHKVTKYFDFYNEDEKKWVFAKMLDFKDHKVTFQLMEQDHTISIMKLKEYPMKEIRPLGSKIQQKVQKKLFMRRYNSVLQKMQGFGFHYMISYPKEINYLQLEKVIQIALRNYVENLRRNKPYFIRILQAHKGKCLFCSQTQTKFDRSGKDKESESFLNCCSLTQEQKEVPLIWLAKQQPYSIFVDWKSLDDYNTTFASVAEVDTISSGAEKARLEDKLNIQQCLELSQKSESVETQCEKCKHKSSERLEAIKSAPNILILHMKQFRFTPDHQLIKIDVNIRWVEFLDLSKYSMNSSGNLYQLYAYVRHTGSSESGHYTCVAKRRHPFQNKRVWVNFDDEQTSIMQTEQKNIDSAYLLFFKKVDMPVSTYINYTGLQEIESGSMSMSKELGH